MSLRLEAYADTIGEVGVDHLRRLGRELRGARVLHVNSTRTGGGVAEILAWMIPLMNDLGLEATWETIQGDGPFFHVTKSFHNGLQGKDVVLTKGMLATYEQTVAANDARLASALDAADFVFIHDPQPAHLLSLHPNRRGKWIWRCHVDVSRPDRGVWNYLKGRVAGYDASIFSMPGFARSLPHPQVIIAPSIDPLSEKNLDLDPVECASTMDRLGVPRDVPIVSQISRFDRFKDPVGVIRAFRMLRAEARLVLAGGGAADDPEGAAVLEEVMEEAAGDPRIHALMLPGDAHRTINAIQRSSAIVLQKSLQEGFGLTVTEALWKGRPVIGGDVGGIRLQVHDGHTGFLVNSPEGAALRMRRLLHRPEERERMGRTGRAFVRENFLLNRHLREYLTLMLGLRAGMDATLRAA